MKLLIAVIFSGLLNALDAQNSENNKFERKGFIFGASLGVAAVNLNFPLQPQQNEITASLPNIKVGSMISDRSALLVYLPGSIYTYSGSGRERDRGFEALIPSFQYWIKDRWWVLGGAGIGIDAPAFYDIQNEDERKFYFGGSLILGTGFEIWRKEKFVLDIQSRIHYSSLNVAEGTMTGYAFNFLLGFNWY